MATTNLGGKRLLGSLVVRERSILSDLLKWLSPAIPLVIRKTLFVRSERVTLPTQTPPRARGKVTLALGPELVLRRRLAIPKRARSQLRAAIQLLIETETPFDPDELLVHAFRLKNSNSLEATYDIRLVPRRTLLDMADTIGVPPKRIARILADAGSGELADFSHAAFPLRRVTRWLPAVPLLLLVATATTWGLESLSDYRERAGRLEDDTNASLAELKALSAQINDIQAVAQGQDAMAQEISGTASAYNTIQQVRTVLADTTQLSRLQLRGKELRLSIKAPDVLASAHDIAASSFNWTANIEGPITVEQSTGLEQATIVVRGLADSS